MRLRFCLWWQLLGLWGLELEGHCRTKCCTKWVTVPMHAQTSRLTRMGCLASPKAVFPCKDGMNSTSFSIVQGNLHLKVVLFQIWLHHSFNIPMFLLKCGYCDLCLQLHNFFWTECISWEVEVKLQWKFIWRSMGPYKCSWLHQVYLVEELHHRILGARWLPQQRNQNSFCIQSNSFSSQRFVSLCIL